MMYAIEFYCSAKRDWVTLHAGLFDREKAIEKANKESGNRPIRVINERGAQIWKSGDLEQ